MSERASAVENICDRRIWPVSWWPEADQQLWHDACEGRGTWERFNPACGWSHSWRTMIEEGYGRYIGWLAKHHRLDAVHPADRIHPDVFTRFVNDLTDKGLAAVSVANLARKVRAFAAAIDPEGDWHWLAY